MLWFLISTLILSLVAVNRQVLDWPHYNGFVKLIIINGFVSLAIIFFIALFR